MRVVLEGPESTDQPEGTSTETIDFLLEIMASTIRSKGSRSCPWKLKPDTLNLASLLKSPYQKWRPPVYRIVSRLSVADHCTQEFEGFGIVGVISIKFLHNGRGETDVRRKDPNVCLVLDTRPLRDIQSVPNVVLQQGHPHHCYPDLTITVPGILGTTRNDQDRAWSWKHGIDGLSHGESSELHKLID